MALHPLILWASAALACPAIDAELERATQFILAGDAAGTASALADADAAFLCAPATPAQAGRWFLVAGAARHLAGADATPWLAAARLASPEFDARFGPELRAAWEKAAPAGTATLLLEPALPARIDGGDVPAGTATVASGPHLVQVVDPAGEVRFSKPLALAPGEDALVPTGLPPVLVAEAAPLPEAPAEPTPAVKKKSPLFLVGAAVAAAAGGACAGGAVAQNGLMEGATEVGALDAARGRQEVFAGAAYGLWGVAGAAAVLHFVLP
jgi:hypothetical protein